MRVTSDDKTESNRSASLWTGSRPSSSWHLLQKISLTSSTTLKMYFYTEPQRKIISHCSQHESIWCLYFFLCSVKVIIVVHVYYASFIRSRTAANAERVVKKQPNLLEMFLLKKTAMLNKKQMVIGHENIREQHILISHFRQKLIL